MNSLKKIAAISAIICGIALVLAIILTPFAVSSAIDFYNAMVEKAEANAEKYVIDTTLDSAIRELTIADSAYYGIIQIQESTDGQIHILNQDRGFDYIVPEVTVNGSTARVTFHWHNDPKLTEENILQLLAAELNDNYRQQTIIQLPADASLHLDEEYLDDLYYHVDLKYSGFANAEQLRQQLDQWYASTQTARAYEQYLEQMNNQLQDTESLRCNVTENLDNDYFVDTASFVQTWAGQYAQLESVRMDMAKNAYQFRLNYSGLPEESLTEEYLEVCESVRELCEAEQNYDLLSVQRMEAEWKLADGEISQEDYQKLRSDSFQRQPELELRISTLSSRFQSYCLEPDWENWKQETEESTVEDTASVPLTTTSAEQSTAVQTNS